MSVGVWPALLIFYFLLLHFILHFKVSEDLPRGVQRIGFLMVSGHQFHKTLPSLRLILGLRTSPNPAL